MSEATLAVKSGKSSTLDSPNKEQQQHEDASKSSDPLILEVKTVNNQDQESNNASRHSRKPSDDQRRCDEKNQPVMTAVPPQKLSRSYSQTYDGVFSNLCAKPEIMVLPPGNPQEHDSPPPYQDQRPRHAAYPGEAAAFANISEVNLSDCIDDIYLDDMEVGSVLSYVVMCFFVLVFQFYGMIIGIILSQSHATRFGTFGGVGLLLAFASPSIERALAETVRPGLKDYMPLVGIALGMIGYMLFIYSIVAFKKVRKTAELMLAPPRGPQQAHYEVAAV